MTLYERVIERYPELTDDDFVTTIKLRDDMDGAGEYIETWSHPSLPRPDDL